LVTASWDSTVKVWQCAGVQSQQQKGGKSVLVAELAEHDSEVRTIDLDGSARMMVAGCIDGLLIFWDLTNLEGGCVRTIDAHEGAVTSARFTPDGARVVSGGEDGFLKVHEVFGGEVFNVSLGCGLRCLATDGQFILCGTETGQLLVYELVSGSLLASFSAHQSAVSSLSFSADGSVIVSASDDGVIKVWAVPS
jgi:factor associated with neutral sphingomyelinase activation